MKMQVKVFERRDEVSLEGSINIWLEEHQGVRVEHVSQSRGFVSEGDQHCVLVCIWYTAEV